MYVQYLTTDHFGEGLCVYRSEAESPEDYCGDLEIKVAGPFASEADADAWLDAKNVPEDIRMIL